MRIKGFYYIVIIFSIMTLQSCSKDREKSRILFDEDSKELAAKGVTIAAEGGKAVLNFTHSDAAEISARIVSTGEEASWLSVKCESAGSNRSRLIIDAAGNPAVTERNVQIILQVNETTAKLNVVQSAVKIIIQKSNVVVLAPKTKITIQCQSNGEVKTLLKTEQPEWIKVSDIRKQGHDTEIDLSIEENLSLGRIAGLVLQTEEGTSKTIAIRQYPGPFKEKEEITTKEAGQLPVLLGNDIANLRNIRSLTISGPLNGHDVNSLKQLFIWKKIKNEEIDPYTIELDLSKATILGNYKNPFESYGFMAGSPDDKINFRDYEIPESMFANADNLVSLKLPLNTQAIGRAACSYCRRLPAIDIPDNVKQIGTRAFFRCENIKEINIGEKSMLSAIGQYAFSTSSVIQSLRLPALTDFDNYTLTGLRCRQLYVSWQEPPETAGLPATADCTLFVPAGTKDKYLASAKWSRFSKIEEY